MAWIREYLPGVIAAALLCSVVMQLAGKNDLVGSAIKLICGVFMLLALISPVMKLRISTPQDIFTDVSDQAASITASASDSTRESFAGIIKDKLQSYILDKANDYGLELSVEITLSDSDLPEPVSVQISGSVSPYHKKLLSDMIAQDLGVPTEAQIWN